MTITFDEDQSIALLELLGLPADADPTDIAAILAVIEDLAKQAAEGEGGKPSDIAAAAKRVGLAVTDPDSYARLQAEATEGRQIKAAAAAAKDRGIGRRRDRRARSPRAARSIGSR